MENDPLQQLRDIHLPADPSWWPPAIGWWILAILVIGVVYYLVTTLLSAWRRRRPIRVAKKTLHGYHQSYVAGDLSAIDFVHKCNELLKRLLVRALGRHDLGPESSTKWLQALDTISQSEEFTQGSGNVLGNVRFAPNLEPDVPGLLNAVQGVISKVKP